MSKIWRAILLSFSACLSATRAEAECDALSRLRRSGDVHFRDIRGTRKDPDFSWYTVTYSMDGGHCELDGSESEPTNRYRCRWYVSQDEEPAKSAYSEMLTSTRACIKNAPNPPRQRNRGESTEIDDSFRRRVYVTYGFERRWWYVEFEYECSYRDY